MTSPTAPDHRHPRLLVAALVALTWGAMAASGVALSAVEIPKMGGEAVKPDPAPAPGPAAEPLGEEPAPVEGPVAEPGWTVGVNGGDQITGKLVRIADGKLVLAPSFAPDSPITLDLAKVDSLASAAVDDPGLRGDQVLRLHDGTEFFGKLSGIGLDSVQFNADLLGAIRVPTKYVAAIHVRSDSAPTAAAPAGEGAETKAIIVTTGGDTVFGAVSPDGKSGVRVSSPTMEAVIPIGALALIEFPQPPEVAATPAGLMCTATLRSGAIWTGSAPKVEDGSLSMQMVLPDRVTIPLTQVSEMTFTLAGGEGGIGGSNILVWGRYADKDEECAHTVTALTDKLPKSFKVETNFAEKVDADFKRSLFRSRCLVIPEMESYDDDSGKEFAAALKPLLADYTRRGGVIVICSMTDSTKTFFEAAGIVDGITTGGSSDGTTIPFTPAGKKLGAGLADGVTTANATYFYKDDGGKWQAMATSGDTSPVMGRKTKAGWVFVLGFDFYEFNDSIAQTISNAARFR